MQAASAHRGVLESLIHHHTYNLSIYPLHICPVHSVIQTIAKKFGKLTWKRQRGESTWTLNKLIELARLSHSPTQVDSDSDPSCHPVDKEKG